MYSALKGTLAASVIPPPPPHSPTLLEVQNISILYGLTLRTLWLNGIYMKSSLHAAVVISSTNCKLHISQTGDKMSAVTCNSN